MAERTFVAFCRGGFETECAEDLRLLAERGRFACGTPDVSTPGLVALPAEDPGFARLGRLIAADPPVFCRSIVASARSVSCGTRDRIGPIVAAAGILGGPFRACWLEHPDTNEGKTLSGLCRRLAPLVERTLGELGPLQPSNARLPRLHVVFTRPEHAFIGVADETVGSRWPMGIPRLHLPRQAPSRSTLKLAEALLVLCGDDAAVTPRAGQRAVDLGAAPGGWTWQLVQRGVRVTAVDRAALADSLVRDPLVTHLAVDGFGFRPRRPVDWLLCDIVEQPSRVAALVADWIGRGDAPRALFNLKLPMRRRHLEVQRCREIIEERMARAGRNYRLVLRQLYHDREEITGLLERRN